MQAFKCVRIDGSITSSGERQARIARFNSDKGIDVFLLTTQCGGVGITLNGADRVVIFDPAWNPAVDAQAVDRCYRVGQTRDVIVYRFITCGTIEEKVYRKQVFKGGLERVCSP
jgi:SNF2 family DNA or RNA helicase